MNKTLILNEIKEYLKIKYDKDFADFLGIKTTTLAMWYKRNTFDIELIFTKCDFLNSEWLLTGRGEMLKTNLMAEANNKVSEPERKPPDDRDRLIIELQQHRIASLEKDLSEREREIDQLKKELKTAYDRSVVR